MGFQKLRYSHFSAIIVLVFCIVIGLAITEKANADEGQTETQDSPAVALANTVEDELTSENEVEEEGSLGEDQPEKADLQHSENPSSGENELSEGEINYQEESSYTPLDEPLPKGSDAVSPAATQKGVESSVDGPKAEETESNRNVDEQKEDASRLVKSSAPLVQSAKATSKTPSTAQSNASKPKYDTPIASGDYLIRSMVNIGFVLDVAGGSKSDSANVQIYRYNKTEAQKWRVTYDANGYYSIMNIGSGKLLDLSGARVANGSNIHQYTKNGTGAQKWIILKSGSQYTIASAINKAFVIDISGGYAADFTNVQLYKSNNTAAQRFVFTPLDSGSRGEKDTSLPVGDYLIQSSLSNLYVLDVAGGSKAKGANVQTYSYNGTSAQKWRVTYDKDGFYTFKNIGSGKVLDVSGGKAWYGNNVQQYGSNRTKAQKWILENHSGRYTIHSAIDPMFSLDVLGGHASNGSNVQIYVDNGTQAQRFMFIPLAPDTTSSCYIEDGVYIVRASQNPRFVLDVSGGALTSGSNVQIYQSNGSYAQKWGIVREKTGFYSIFNMASGKMLDVRNGSPLAGSNVQQYASNNSKAQKWFFQAQGNGDTYALVNAVSGLTLDISGGSYKNGTNVQTYINNGAKSESFKLTRQSLLPSGVYSLFASRGENLVLDLPGNTIKDGASLQVYSHNDSLAQHVVINKLENNDYTLCIVGSGKYITMQQDAIVQKSYKGDKSQVWTASLIKGGIEFKNAATGKRMSVATSSPKDKTAIVQSQSSGIKCAFGLKPCDLISRGLYKLQILSSASGRVLDVDGGSWTSGANAQIYRANGTNAQKFIIAPVEKGYYKITAVLSGLALSGSENGKAGSNVSFRAWQKKDYQLWHPDLTTNGMTFTNKESGYKLGIAKNQDVDKTNVNQGNDTADKTQKWYLISTSVNLTDMSSISKLVRSVSGSGDLSSSMSIDSSRWNNLLNALYACWNRGYDVGFLMTDLQSGHFVSINADRTYYGASTIKGPYVTWIFENLLETGAVSWSDVGYLIVPTIEDSNNDAYHALRNRFGDSGFNSWLNGVGLSGWGDARYTFYTPRQLQLMWVRMLAYEQSGGAYVGTWRSTFDSTYYSTIHESLGGYKTTYTKPGWYPRTGNYGALDDSGIVIGSDGSRYLLTIMSDINCYGDQELERNVVRSLNAIFDEYGGYR